MTDAVAYDDNGVPMQLHDLISITPASLVSVCRDAALEFLQQHTDSGATDAETMMNLPLYAPGVEEPTHWYCVRKAYCNEVRVLEQFMAAKESPDFADQRFTLEDDPEFIKSHMGIYCGDLAEFIAYLGLEVR